MTAHVCGHGTAIVAGRLLGVCNCWAQTPGDILNGAVEALTAEGCVCNPRLMFEEFAPEKYRVTALHDSWCPRLRTLKAVDN